MGAYSDFVAFFDGGSRVPFFSKNGRYTTKPNIISVQFDYEFKTYYKSYNHYFVGIACDKLVRFIYRDEFEMMLALYNKTEENKVNINQGLQLVFDL